MGKHLRAAEENEMIHQMTRWAVMALLAIGAAGCERGGVYYDPDADLADYEYIEADAPAEESEVFAYFPLSEGSWWNYGGAGNEYAPFKRSVVARQGNRFQVRDETSGTVVAAVYEIDEDTVRLVASQEEAYADTPLFDAPANRDEVILQTPLTVGTSWWNGNRQRTIVDTSSRVESSGGIYQDCLEVESRSTGSSATTHEFYCRGIGLVQRVFQDGDTTIYSFLKDHKIVK